MREIWFHFSIFRSFQAFIDHQQPQIAKIIAFQFFLAQFFKNCARISFVPYKTRYFINFTIPNGVNLAKKLHIPCFFALSFFYRILAKDRTLVSLRFICNTKRTASAVLFA